MLKPSPDPRKKLKTLLRVIGVTGALAYPCAFLPHEWMNSVAVWTGLGALPDEPIVSYLSRSLSLFYGMVSSILLRCSFDIDRFEAVIRVFGFAATLLGVFFLFHNQMAGMPKWWTWTEGPATCALGLAVIWLSRSK